MSTPLDGLAVHLAALYEVRQDLRDDFDRAEAALIAKLQSENKKTFEMEGYTFRLEAIPIVACRSCGHAIEAPAGLPDHTPMRIKITKKKEIIVA